MNPILAFATSFVVAYAFLPAIIRFSKDRAWGSRPDRRRIHKRITPSLGGVAIFFGFTLTCLIWAFDYESPFVFLLLAVLIIPFVIGLLDDLIHLTPAAKLTAQCITASLLFYIVDIRLTSVYDFFGGIEFPTAISFAVTVSAVVIITNSLNLIDGIDGLAATFSFVSCLFFGGWFLLAGHPVDALICMALAGSILAFLFQNWEPSNIFMGDTGSLVIGTLLAVFMIRFVNANHDSAPENVWRFNSSVITAICVLIIPLADTVRIILVRLSRGISPFKADKRHIHHRLIRLGFSHREAVYILIAIHIAMIALAIVLRDSHPLILLGLVLVISILLCLWLDRRLVRLVRENGESRT